MARKDTAEIFACIFLLAVLGIVLYCVVCALERFCVWWKPPQQEAAMGSA